MGRLTSYRVDNCCCCCSPRVGTLTIGWLTVICGALNFLSTIRVLASGEDVVRSLQEVVPECDQECVDYFRSGFYTGQVFSIVINLFSVILAALLIYGVNKRRPAFMTPILVCYGISIAIYGIALIIGTILLLVLGHAVMAIVLFVAVGLVLLLIVHFFFVIRTHQLEIIDLNTHDPVPLKERGFNDPY